jgi:hypothetical protein
LRKALLRAFQRIRNLVREVHIKLTAWLCENYDLIILPEFGSARMVKRAGRKINSKTARSMLTWSHYGYGFRQYLMHKIREYPGVTVKLCTEEYTSKTCGVCGQLNDGLGGSKRFCCPNALCPLNNPTPADAARTLRAAQRKQKRRPSQGARKRTPPKEPASVRLAMGRDANAARNILLKALAEATGGKKPPRPSEKEKAAGKRTPRKAKAVNARKQDEGVIPELHLNGDGAPAAAAPTQLSGAKRTRERSPTTHVGGIKRRCIGAAVPAPQNTRRPRQRGDIAASSLVREPEDASGFSADAEAMRTCMTKKYS